MKRICLFLFILLLGVQTVSAARLDPEWYGKVHTISTLDAKGNVIKTEQVKADSLGNIVWKDGKEYKQPPGHLPKYTSFKMNGKTYTMVEKYGQMPEIREGRY